MNFKISSFLYLHHDEYKSDNWERTAIRILNRLNQYKILKVEERKESNETAISFETYIQADNKEIAENAFLDIFEGYDVDNYNVIQE